MSRLAEELLSRSLAAADTTEVNRKVARRFSTSSVVGDAAVVFGAMAFAFWLRFRTSYIGAPEPDLSYRVYLPSMVIAGVSLMLLLSNYGMYLASPLLRYWQSAFLIIKGCILWSLGVFVALRLFDFPTLFLVRYLGIGTVCVLMGLLLWRALLHRIASMNRFSKHLRERILFVGWNEFSERLTKFVTRDPSQTYTVVGCIPPPSGVYESDPPATIPHIAGFRDIVNMLRRKSIDIVMLADRTASMAEIDDLATICEKELVQLKVIPSYFQILVTGLSLQTISGVPILGISQLPLDRPVNQIIKRTVDIVGALVGLVLSAPIIAIFGAIVFMESGGPIFYKPRRLGRGGVEFDMIKIRSMRLGADSEGTGHWTVKDDPRRLKIGAFMRKWNIDELPQFWNVLTGTMSLVGPRPESVALIRSFKNEIEHYNVRHTAKPGVTGWAAVNGLRGDTDLSERIRCDLYYLENWSVWLDFQIMFLTFFRRQNAG